MGSFIAITRRKAKIPITEGVEVGLGTLDSENNEVLGASFFEST